jgi:hypothetical protein
VGLSTAANGLAGAGPVFLWPDHISPAAGALAGWGLGTLLAAWMRWGLDASWQECRRASGLALAPGLLGQDWPLASRLHLPPPHDLPVRPLQIFLALLLLTGLALWAWQAFRLLYASAARRPLRWLAWRGFGLAWLLYLLCAPWTAQWTTTGDSPHYLLSTRAWALRGSSDLAPEYKQRSYLLFYDRDDLGEPAADAAGHVRIHHAQGLSLAMVPGYLLLGPWGARWWHAGLAAAAWALGFLLLCRGLPRGQAVLGACLLGFCAAWLLHSQGMMAEVLAGLAWLAALAAWEGILPWWAASLSVGIVVWANVRCFPLAGALLVINLWRWPARRAAGLFVSGLLLFAFLALQAHDQGTWAPLGRLQIGHNESGAYFLWSGMPVAAAGILLDQEYGFLWWCPAFILALAGLRRRWRQLPATSAAQLLSALAYGLPLLTVRYWHGDMAPARYLVPMVPLLALWSAYALDPGKRLSRVLLAWTWGAAWLMAVLPWLCYSKKQGESFLLGVAGKALHLPLTRLFPSYLAAPSAPVAWAWPLFLAALLWCTLKVEAREAR